MMENKKIFGVICTTNDTHLFWQVYAWVSDYLAAIRRSSKNFYLLKNKKVSYSGKVEQKSQECAEYNLVKNTKYFKLDLQI